MTGNSLDRRRVLIGSAATALSTHALAQTSSGRASSQATEHTLAHNVEAVGYSDLDGRPAFKLTIRQDRGRWYLYTGHFWHRGWSVIDVTDPTKAEVVNFIEGPRNTFTGQVDLHGETMITSLEQGLTNAPWGFVEGPFEEGVIIWDLSDAIRPKRVGFYRTGARGTHRNTYAGGRYMHLAAAASGFDGYNYVIVDIADRANPREVGRWSVPGQQWEPGATRGGRFSEARQREMHDAGFYGIDGNHVFNHGPPIVQGSVVWLPYSAAGVIALDISDVTRPRQVGRLGFTPPFHSFLAVHGVLPVPERGIAFVNSEDTSYGKGPAHFAGIIDTTDPTNPFLLSLFPAPIPPSGAPYPDFSARPGWSGPHNFNHLQHNPDVEKQGDLCYVAHFNAGLRIFDVSSKRLPREVGFFMPPDPQQRYGPMPQGELVIQTEDVLVDRRGYIYISDKNQGLWVLRYTGPQPRGRRS
jgi:hypothetical protein